MTILFVGYLAVQAPQSAPALESNLIVPTLMPGGALPSGVATQPAPASLTIQQQGEAMWNESALVGLGGIGILLVLILIQGLVGSLINRRS